MGHLWLVGMMGAGKSAVGARVADLRMVSFVDTDDEIARRMGRSIAQLWSDVGEDGFRDMEEATVRRVAGGSTAVVATGGGVVVRPGNVTAMRGSGLVVWLDAPADVLVGRVGPGRGRPLLAGEEGPERIHGLLAARHDAYTRAAHARVATAGRSIDDIAAEVGELWTAS